MANINAPFGLQPIGSMDGVGGNIGLYLIPSTDANNYFLGDPVVKAGTANTSEIRGYFPGTLPTAAAATAGDTNKVTGVIVGFLPAAGADLGVNYGVASTNRLVLVADCRDTKFVIQTNGTFAVTSVGLNVNLASGSGSTISGKSGWVADIANAAATATFQLKILGVLAEANNEVGDYTKVIVSINNHSDANAVLGL